MMASYEFKPFFGYTSVVLEWPPNATPSLLGRGVQRLQARHGRAVLPVRADVAARRTQTARPVPEKPMGFSGARPLQRIWVHGRVRVRIRSSDDLGIWVDPRASSTSGRSVREISLLGSCENTAWREWC